jgi:hypothetical protein
VGSSNRVNRPAGAAVVVALMAVAGCSAAPDVLTVSPSGPYADRIRELEDEIVSDFERQVLADGLVTRDEYEEAHALLRRCVEDGGGSLQLHPDEHGFHTYEVDARSEQLFLSCEPGTTGVVAGLYRDMTVNPEDADFLDLVRDCMAAAGTVDRATTVEEFRSAFFGEGATALEEPEVAEQFDACFGDPLGLLTPPTP